MQNYTFGKKLHIQEAKISAPECEITHPECEKKTLPVPGRLIDRSIHELYYQLHYAKFSDHGKP